MRGVIQFLRRLDASRARTVWVSLLLFGMVIAIFVLGKTGVVMDLDATRAAMDELSSGPWGLPALIAVFCIAAFLGAPQFVLIGIAVFAFGPILGFAYSWFATLVSGAVTFWVGRLAGEGVVRRHGGNFANRLSAFIGQNAFAASAIVRNVPTGPFLLVNMVFGVSRARFSHYLGGLAIGVLPKISLVAFAGTSIMQAFEGHPILAIFAALVAVGIWIALVLYARARLRGTQNILPESVQGEVDTVGTQRE